MHLGEAVSCKDRGTRRCDRRMCGAEIFFNVCIHPHLYRCLPPRLLSLCVTQFSSLCAVSGGCPVRGIHHPPYAACKALVKTSLQFFFCLCIHHFGNIFCIRSPPGAPSSSSSSSAGQGASMKRVKSNRVWRSRQIWKRRPFKNIVLAGGDVSCRDARSRSREVDFFYFLRAYETLMRITTEFMRSYATPLLRKLPKRSRNCCRK